MTHDSSSDAGDRQMSDPSLLAAIDQLKAQVADLERSHAQLREADRRKDEFLATLAHELRNPLAPISSAINLLRLTGDLSPAVGNVHKIMELQVNHMVRLVDDLLEVSRISRGKMSVRKEPVGLATIIASAIETSRPLIDAAGHQLAVSLPSQPVSLDADPVRLAQVISNLLNNAAKYTSEGGQIWLTARAVAGEAIVSVRDTGFGIPAEMLPQVFDMFAQVDHTLSRAQGGLGIGLTLAKTFVHMHGGRIEAHSDGPGQGSEFVVTIPGARDEGRLPQALSPNWGETPTVPPRRIVIVDDTQAAGYILGKLLEALGQHVQTATSGIAALELIEREHPDVVISDIAMPGMDGYELARRVRCNPALSDVVLVALTGYGQDSDKQQARAAGFDHHLVKPVSMHALQEILAALPTIPSPSGRGLG